MYKNPNKFIQFELWKECHQGCKFCCNKGQPKIDKKESIKYVMDILNSDEINEYNEIGFIGGEFFNGELEPVKEEFYQIFDKIALLNFDRIYITAALIYDIDKSLLPFLYYLNDLEIINKVMICSSFDTIYRFKSQEEKELWKTNMKRLKEIFPSITLHTEIILTEAFMETVLNDEFNIKNFREYFESGLDFIEPSSGLFYYNKEEAAKDLPKFFPKKSTFIKFLKKVSIDNSVDLNTLLSMEVRSNKLYFIANGQRLVADDRRNGDGKCSIPNTKIKYETGFIDSDIPMKNIVNMFKNMI